MRRSYLSFITLVTIGASLFLNAKLSYASPILSISNANISLFQSSISEDDDISNSPWAPLHLRKKSRKPEYEGYNPNRPDIIPPVRRHKKKKYF